MDSKTFILGQLQRAGKKIKMTSAKNANIVCPFHNDHNPSCSVLLVPRSDSGTTYAPGTYNCYACGASGGWKKLAARLNMDMLETGDSKLEEMATALKSMRDDFPHMVYNNPRYHKGWRELSQEFMESLDTRVIEDFTDTQVFGRPVKRLLFPVKVQSTCVGFIKAHRSTEGIDLKLSPKYKYSAGEGWVARALFPYDFRLLTKLIHQYNTAILVEGPYDALRLLSLGFPAMAILGTRTWSPYKLSLVYAKGVERVILLMDGDTPGRRCLEEILVPAFEGAGLMEYEVFKLPIIHGKKIERLHKQMLSLPVGSDERKGLRRQINVLKKDQIDPGNMGQKWLDKLSQMLAGDEEAAPRLEEKS